MLRYAKDQLIRVKPPIPLKGCINQHKHQTNSFKKNQAVLAVGNVMVETYKETFVYRLRFNELCQISAYEVWADSGAAYKASLPRMRLVLVSYEWLGAWPKLHLASSCMVWSRGDDYLVGFWCYFPIPSWKLAEKHPFAIQNTDGFKYQLKLRPDISRASLGISTTWAVGKPPQSLETT